MNSWQLGPEDLGDLKTVLEAEWLETNGLGSFASGTLSGAVSRRYHGLLTVATHPPVGRMHLVSKVAEVLVTPEGTFELDTNCFAGSVEPTGYQYLSSAEASPVPTFHYQVGGYLLRKRVFMIHTKQATAVTYELLEAPGPCRIQLRPMFTFRDFHSLTHQNEALDPTALRPGPAEILFRPYPGVPALHVYHGSLPFEASAGWQQNLHLQAEERRGLPCVEDHWTPGMFACELDPGGRRGLIFSTEPLQTEPDDPEVVSLSRQKSSASMGPDPFLLFEAEQTRREGLAGPHQGKGGLLEALAGSSSHFIVSRGEGSSIIAGYPWFEDWSRDTFISLPGLTLMMDRTDEAVQMLTAYSECIQDGLLPNRFPDPGQEPEYNSVDAPLWYIHALGRYLEKTDDLETLEERLLPVARSIVSAFLEGTRFGIHVDRDGLVVAGEPGMQLTWMDARVEDRVVTRRAGKPVEIQALWYNALRLLESTFYEVGEELDGQAYGELADQVEQSFLKLFWNEDEGYCHDVVDCPDIPGGVDTSLRPNQLLAASLPAALLDSARARRMIDRVRKDLLTPRGLRTLSPSAPGYQRRYQGSPAQRDGSYHQGTVWPWLIGPYCDSLVTAHGGWKPKVIKEVTAVLRSFEDHLTQAGLGFVSEIFEPEAPHEPVGCVAQAWSVGELLRVAAELDRQKSGH